jgi:glucosamine--fructose-6-phosphate aminotransferase (isomerizing)
MLKNINKIKIVGCGTAFHSALIGVRYFQKILNIYSNAEISSEFIYNEPKFLDEKTLFIAVSQSGETADTLKAIEIAKKYKCKIIGITNVEYSSIGNLVDKLLLIYAGEEKAVA